MTGVRGRIEVMHGVNLDMLGVRDPSHYGSLTLGEMETQIAAWAAELELSVSFFQTNVESEYVERLHELRGPPTPPTPPTPVDGVILNPGAWTHYAYAIHDALELADLPAVEVHLSDVQSREPWRRLSVVGDLCLATFSGKGPEGYKLALSRLREALEADV
jgi:3-dehydroquinate dehydratase-2